MNTSKVKGNRYTKLVLKRIRSRTDLGDNNFRDMEFSVSPAIAQELREDAKLEGRPRPRARITDYSRLKPCCPGRQEDDP